MPTFSFPGGHNTILKAVHTYRWIVCRWAKKGCPCPLRCLHKSTRTTRSETRVPGAYLLRSSGSKKGTPTPISPMGILADRERHEPCGGDGIGWKRCLLHRHSQDEEQLCTEVQSYWGANPRSALQEVSSMLLLIHCRNQCVSLKGYIKLSLPYYLVTCICYNIVNLTWPKVCS